VTSSAAIVLTPVVFWLQQYSLGLHRLTLAEAPRETVAAEEVTDPGITGFTLSAKSLVRMANLMRSMHEEEDDPTAADDLKDRALSRVDRLRAAVVAGELQGAAAALERLAELRKEVDPQGDLVKDLGWLERLYHDGVKEIPDDARRALIARHGWFGELALVFDRTAARHERERIVGGGDRLIVVSLALLAAGVVGLIAGVIVLLYFVLRWRRGDLESRLNEAVGGPVYIETFVVFLVGFLIVLAAPIVAFGFDVESTAGAAAVAELLSWLLAVTLAWPLIRGVPWHRYCWDLGLHRGEGVFKEIGCGALAWLASLPVVVGSILVIALVKKIAGVHEDPGPAGYPMFQPPPGGTWATLFLSLMGAVIWAPLVEETAFRGALFRYLRPRAWAVGTVLLTGAVFGFVHPYSSSGLVQIAILGVVLALVREWRGSLIVPMTLHFLHNGAISLVTVLIIGAID
jgi:membrane protease YdiL (CAAX protease family)